MKKQILSILLMAFAAVFAGCSSENKQVKNYSPYVDAVTSNVVPRDSKISIEFNREIIDSYANGNSISKYVSISPALSGDWVVLNDNKLIEFTPSKPLKAGKTYTVVADVNELLGVDKPDGKFKFEFTAFAWQANAFFSDYSIDDSGEGLFKIKLSVITVDRESDEDVENCGTFSESFQKIEWTHSTDGKRHEATISGIKGGKTDYDFCYFYKADESGNKRMVKANIPAFTDFDVWQVNYLVKPTRCIEVAFNSSLGEAETVASFIKIDGKPCEQYEADGNTFRIFIDGKAKGKVNVLVMKGLPNREAKQTNEDRTFEVDLGGDKPELSLLRTGSLIPLTDNLIIPFTSCYYRGVLVKVVKIKERNIGQFLQVNNISGSSELKRVGRLVAHKFILFDSEENDLSATNTFAIKLNELITPEPGAIYRVSLTVEKRLSAYPGANETTYTDAELTDYYNSRESSAASRYDYNSDYYYYDDDDDYYWRSSDPTQSSYYNGRVCSVNVLATNLGIVAESGCDNKMNVWVNNLLTTSPEPDVDLKMYNYQGDQIATARTDANGFAVFDKPENKAFYIAAYKGEQRTYMRVDNGSALSTSNFDVGGEILHNGTRGFIYGERGVWRPGDTLHLAFILNDRIGNIGDDYPVTISLSTPQGQLYTTRTVPEGSMGLYCFDLPIAADAPTGQWTARVTAGNSEYSKYLRVETVKPNRLKVALTVPDNKLTPANNIVSLHSEWLNGNPVRNLKYDIKLTVSKTSTAFEKYSDYTFEDSYNRFRTEELPLVKGALDADGNANTAVNLATSTNAPGKMRAGLTTKVYEESGDFSINSISVPYSPFSRYIGIKEPKADTRYGWLSTDNPHEFSIVSVDDEGNPVPNVECKVSVYKLKYWWWWDSDDGEVAEYVNDSYREPVTTARLTTNSSGIATYRMEVNGDNWGSYYIRVADARKGHSTAITSYFDWPSGQPRQTDGDSESAFALNFQTDKAVYAPGEQAQVSFYAPNGSRAIVNVENGSKILSTANYFFDSDGNKTVPIDVTPEMAPNAYIHIMLIQRYQQSDNDRPIRMYGVTPLIVDNPDSHLLPVATVADKLRSCEAYTVKVSEQKGRPMSYTLAIVDEGLLDLTNFKTPDPWRAFNGKEALGIRYWDVYNNILGAYGGKIEQMFSIGGDEEGSGNSDPTADRFNPVVQFVGPCTLDKGKTETHKLYMPNYNGRVRVMVIATNGKAFGSTDKSVFVARPLMVTATLPRMIGCDEEMEVSATVFATEQGMGNVNVKLKVSDGMTVIGDSKQVVELNSIGDKTVKFRVRTSATAQVGNISLTCEAKGEKASYSTPIEVQHRQLPQSKSGSYTIAAGESQVIKPELFGMSGTNDLSLEVSTIVPINLNERLNYLVGYPHGCIEQTTSKVLAQLMLSELTTLSPLKAYDVQKNVQSGLNKYRGFQTVSGGMAYWQGNRTPDEWGSIYAMHCITTAEAKGYRIPDGVKPALLNYLKSEANRWTYSSRNSKALIQAYRLYVLALNNMADMSAMNRMKGGAGSLGDNTSWFLAGSYALAGRKDIANEILAHTVESEYGDDDYSYGSTYRDIAVKAMVLTDLGRVQEAADYIKQISDIMSDERWLSTQSIAFCLYSVSHFYEVTGKPQPAEFRYEYDGNKQDVNSKTELVSTFDLCKSADSYSPLTVTNKGKSAIFVKVRRSGIPPRATEEAFNNKLALDVRYIDYNTKQEVAVTNLHSGDNIEAVITVRNTTDFAIRNVAIEQYIPSGWEILNERFMEGGQAESNSLSYQDIRDDRVYSYIDYLAPNKKAEITVKLCATYGGKFYLPPVKAYAMYDIDKQANTVGAEVEVK